MKKLISFIAALFLALCCVSCNEKKESEAITLMVGDYIYGGLDFENIKSIDYGNEECAVVTYNGMYRGMVPGTTNIKITYKNNKEKNIALNVVPRSILNVDEELNAKYEKQAKQKAEAYERKIKFSNYLTIDVVESLVSSKTYSIRMSANPFYVERSASNKTNIIKKEKGIFYEYKSVSEHYLKEKIAIEDEDFDEFYKASVYYFDSSKLLDFMFNKSNGNAYYNGEYYIFRGYYRDMLTDEMKEEIENSGASSNNLSALMNSITTLYFKFDGKKAIAGISASVQIGERELSMYMAYSMNTEKFEKIKLNDDNILIKRPNNLEDVVDETKMVNVPYKFGSDSILTECVKTKLEKGQYVAETLDGKEVDFVSVVVFDENKNKVPQVGTAGVNFYIPEDGVYYLMLYKNITGIKTFIIKKTNNEQNPNITIPIETKVYEFANEKDYKQFGYDNQTGNDQILEIKNNSDSRIVVTHKFYGDLSQDSTTKTYLEMDQVGHFYMQPGENKILIQVWNQEEKVSVPLEMRVFDYNFSGGVYKNDYENIEAVSSDKTYMLGVKNQEAWFTMKIEKTGDYKLSTEGKASINIVKMDGYSISGNKNVFHLEEGEYYIAFKSKKLVEFKFSIEYLDEKI